MSTDQRAFTHPKLSALSNCQASLVSLPVRPNVHPLASALGTLHAQAEGRNLDLVGAVVKANDYPVQAPEGELAHRPRRKQGR
jgi:hypothetical protein